MPNSTVFTIGHSAHSMAAFIELLQLHAVSAVADVRSAPYSRFAPEFNRETLKKNLLQHGIRYSFMGDELGGRSRNSADYENGQVRYASLSQGSAFAAGVRSVIEVATDDRLVLLCAEKEPLECHRAILVGRELDRLGVAVEHIHADGRLETHDSAMTRLLQVHHIQELSLFDTRKQLIDEACALQEKRIAYVDLGMRARVIADVP